MRAGNGVKRSITFGVALCGLLILPAAAMAVAGEGQQGLALRWDTATETTVAEVSAEATASAAAAPQEPKEGGGQPQGAPPAGGGKTKTGNDPREFSSKFMPYWRFTELENKLESWDFTVFGMWAMSSKFALTYEVPVARYYDIRETSNCAGLPDVPCFGGIPFEGNPTTGSPLLVGAGEGDGEEVGLGDSIIRVFVSPGKTFLGGAFIPGIDITVPTATKDILGGEQLIMGPIFTFVWDFKPWPAPGAFFAMMNIFQFDIYGDSGRGHVKRYLGRWFLQLPINKKHKLYIMTEFQPVWDEANDHFSAWLGPEFGKAFTPGKGIFRNGGAIYFKPGIGIGADDNSGDRSWSFEIGWRHFFPAPRETFKMMQQKMGGG